VLSRMMSGCERHHILAQFGQLGENAFVAIQRNRSKRLPYISALHRRIGHKLGHAGTRPPVKEVFQDFPIVCGGEGLFANLTVNQVIYNLYARTHTHHLIVRLTLRKPTLELAEWPGSYSAHGTSTARLSLSAPKISASARGYLALVYFRRQQR